MEQTSVVDQESVAIKVLLSSNNKTFEFEKIQEVIPDRSYQLVAYKIKEKVEEIMRGKDPNSVKQHVRYVAIICENGIPVKAEIVPKESPRWKIWFWNNVSNHI